MPPSRGRIGTIHDKLSGASVPEYWLSDHCIILTGSTTRPCSTGQIFASRNGPTPASANHTHSAFTDLLHVTPQDTGVQADSSQCFFLQEEHSASKTHARPGLSSSDHGPSWMKESGPLGGPSLRRSAWLEIAASLLCPLPPLLPSWVAQRSITDSMVKRQSTGVVRPQAFRTRRSGCHHRCGPPSTGASGTRMVQVEDDILGHRDAIAGQHLSLMGNGHWRRKSRGFPSDHHLLQPLLPHAQVLPACGCQQESPRVTNLKIPYRAGVRNDPKETT